MQVAEETLAGRLGSFAAGLSISNVPRVVAEKAQACLLYTYGIGIGSNNLPQAPVARRAVLEMEGEQRGGATIFGDGRRTTIGGATLANGVLFHARNQEDTCGSTHVGPTIVPVLTALLEAKALPVERLLPALIAGYETAALLDREYAGKMTARGFRATPLFGAIGAAAAVARLYSLSALETQAALANAAGFAGGTLQSQADGCDEWRYQAGIAGRIGLIAAQLAKAGSQSAPRAFEGRAGFLKAYAGADCDAPALTRKLGEEWNILDVAFKPFPLPAWNQAPVALALRMRDSIGEKALKRIEVRMNPYEVNYPGKNAAGPFASVNEAKQSISFSVATVFAHGYPSFPLLLDYKNAKTAGMLEKMKLVADTAVSQRSCTIVLGFEDGGRLTDTLAHTAQDCSFGSVEVSRLVRTVGGESGVPASAYDLLEDFVMGLPAQCSIQQVVEGFSLMP